MAYSFSNLIQHVAIYVRGLYAQNQGPALLYHNLEHTETVVQRTYKIAANYSFTEREIFILVAAAWFHDTGHLFGAPEYHEERGVSIMTDYLTTKKVEKKIIDAVAGCILATKLPQAPKNLLEEIVCDADTSNLGTKDFLYTDSQLKKEYELRNIIPGEGWDKSTLGLLLQHRYFTPYCQGLLNKGKQENIEMVERRIKKDS